MNDSTPFGDTTMPGGPRPPTFEPGALIANRFIIKALVGKGGMGAVYAATDTTLEGQVVALKTMLPDFEQSATALQRFKREVQYARMITHPNVCRIFDAGQHEVIVGGQTQRVLFVTMELLSGETLSSLLDTAGAFSPAQALPVVRQIAAGLGAAHAAGIVHRDLKTANVMLVPGKQGPRVVITDFGVACLVSEETNAMSRLTSTGVFVGSPRYVAPEQIDGGEITQRTDIYAFGIVMYEMLTGHFPFTGSTPIAAAVKRLNEPPTPPRRFVPSIDPTWEAVILRCLARNPEQRFQSMAEVVAALEPARPAPSLPTLTATIPVASPVIESKPPRAFPLRPRWIVAALMALLVLASIVIWRGRRDEPAGPGTTSASFASIVPPEETPTPASLRAGAEAAYRRHDFAEARRLLKTAADAGDVEAEARLGWLTYQCMGAPCDLATATRLLEHAAAAGSHDAEAWVAWLWQLRGSNKLRAFEYATAAATRGKLVGVLALAAAHDAGVVVKRDVAEADRQYRLALPGLMEMSNEGDPWAQNMLGYLYSHGRGGLTSDSATALEWFRKSAATGYVGAQSNIALMYLRGTKPLEKDVAKAIELLRPPAGQGFPLAQDQLANLYYDGADPHLAKDAKKAVELYRAAADGGYDEALFHLGNAYREGEGVTKNLPQALKLFQQAADRGNDSACNTLGFMYYNAEGVTQDRVKAKDLFAQAAAQENPYGQRNLGLMYQNGEGGLPQSDPDAVHWYRKAADQDYALAQVNLAQMYEEGRGVAKDPAEALRLYRKAADAGNDSAKKAVARLSAGST